MKSHFSCVICPDRIIRSNLERLFINMQFLLYASSNLMTLNFDMPFQHAQDWDLVRNQICKRFGDADYCERYNIFKFLIMIFCSNTQKSQLYIILHILFEKHIEHFDNFRNKIWSRPLIWPKSAFYTVFIRENLITIDSNQSGTVVVLAPRHSNLLMRQFRCLGSKNRRQPLKQLWKHFVSNR